MTQLQTSTCFESYLCDLTLDEYIDFLEENKISYSKIPRFPFEAEPYVRVVPNHPQLKARNFSRDHKQMRA
jgi:hypothetical protein